MISDTHRVAFTVSGLDQLDPDRAYLFMSNHRDIAMDPAFTNYALHMARPRDHAHCHRRQPAHQALGVGPDAPEQELYRQALPERSAGVAGGLPYTFAKYIRFSLQVERAPVWIAQREGRAKDGVDRTEPAVIKMLSMSRDKQDRGLRPAPRGPGHRAGGDFLRTGPL